MNKVDGFFLNLFDILFVKADTFALKAIALVLAAKITLLSFSLLLVSLVHVFQG